MSSLLISPYLCNVVDTLVKRRKLIYLLHISKIDTLDKLVK